VLGRPGGYEPPPLSDESKAENLGRRFAKPAPTPNSSAMYCTGARFPRPKSVMFHCTPGGTILELPLGSALKTSVSFWPASLTSKGRSPSSPIRALIVDRFEGAGQSLGDRSWDAGDHRWVVTDAFPAESNANPSPCSC